MRNASFTTGARKDVDLTRDNVIPLHTGNTSDHRRADAGHGWRGVLGGLEASEALELFIRQLGYDDAEKKEFDPSLLSRP